MKLQDLQSIYFNLFLTIQFFFFLSLNFLKIYVFFSYLTYEFFINIAVAQSTQK